MRKDLYDGNEDAKETLLDLIELLIEKQRDEHPVQRGA